MIRGTTGLLALLMGTACLAQSASERWALLRDCAAMQVSTDQALTACDAYLAIPRLSPQQQATALTLRGNLWGRRGDADRSLADFAESLRIDPSLGFTYSSRAEVLFRRGDYDGAIADHTEAIRLKPDDRYLYRQYEKRAFAKLAKGDFDGVLEDLDQYDRLRPQGNTAFYRAIVLLNRGNLDRAIEEFSEMIQRSPGAVQAYHYRASAWAKKGDHDRAIADYTEAIRIDPRSAASYRGRGESWREKGDHGRATADFDEAARLPPHRMPWERPENPESRRQ